MGLWSSTTDRQLGRGRRGELRGRKADSNSWFRIYRRQCGQLRVDHGDEYEPGLYRIKFCGVERLGDQCVHTECWLRYRVRRRDDTRWLECVRSDVFVLVHIATTFGASDIVINENPEDTITCNHESIVHIMLW